MQIHFITPMQKNKRITNIIRFCRFARKGYSAFVSMHRVVNIGHLASYITDLQMQKSSRISSWVHPFDKFLDAEDACSLKAADGEGVLCNTMLFGGMPVVVAPAEDACPCICFLIELFREVVSIMEQSPFLLFPPQKYYPQ